MPTVKFIARLNLDRKISFFKVPLIFYTRKERLIVEKITKKNHFIYLIFSRIVVVIKPHQHQIKY